MDGVGRDGPALWSSFQSVRGLLFGWSRECGFPNFISTLFVSRICRILHFNAVQDPFSSELQEEVFLVHCLCSLQLVFIDEEDLYGAPLCPLGGYFDFCEHQEGALAAEMM